MLPDYLSPIANIINITLSSEEKSLSTCDASNAVNGTVICVNNQQCRYRDVKTTSVYSDICCGGA